MADRSTCPASRVVTRQVVPSAHNQRSGPTPPRRAQALPCAWISVQGVSSVRRNDVTLYQTGVPVSTSTEPNRLCVSPVTWVGWVTWFWFFSYLHLRPLGLAENGNHLSHLTQTTITGGQRLRRLWPSQTASLMATACGTSIKCSRNRLFEPARPSRLAQQLHEGPLFWRCCLPNTNNPLRIECPKCRHDRGRLLAESITVITVTCASCHHAWATDLSSLPLEIQEKVHAALRNM